MSKKRVILILPALMIAGTVLAARAVPAFAQDSVEDLKKQIEALKIEVAALKAAPPQMPPQAPADPARVTGPALDADPFASWDPFAEMRQMQDRMNRMFRSSLMKASALPGAASPGFESFYEPDLDIQDLQDHYLLKLDLPGLEKDKINIEVTDREILISGQREFSNEEQDDTQGFYRMERHFGSFSRRLPLPEDATSVGVGAEYEKGVLTITVPKKQAKVKEEAKKVKVG